MKRTFACLLRIAVATAVIGLGNPMRRDDGVGPAAVARGLS